MKTDTCNVDTLAREQNRLARTILHAARHPTLHASMRVRVADVLGAIRHDDTALADDGIARIVRHTLALAALDPVLLASIRNAAQVLELDGARNGPRPIAPDELWDLLSLVLPVQYLPSVDALGRHSQADRDEACDWASAEHLRASDNLDVVVPPMPAWLKTETKALADAAVLAQAGAR